MADSWEDYEAEETIAVAQGAYVHDEGADDEDVKDSWDIDDDDENEENQQQTNAPIKKKRTLQQAIEERKQAEEKKKQELLERRAKEQAETEEDPAERRRRLAQLERDADMENTVDLFSGVTVTASTAALAASTAAKGAVSLDTMQPKTKQELEDYATALNKKIQGWKLKSSLMTSFLDTFFREVVDGLDYADIRKLSSSLSTIANEKQRLEKERKSGGKKSGKKAQVKVSVEEPAAAATYDNYADYDDFM
jgi:translation initiation factor 3 subunit J